MTIVPRLPEPPTDESIPLPVREWMRNMVVRLERFLQEAGQDYQTNNAPIVLVPSTVSGLTGYLTASGTYRYKPALTQNSASRLLFCSNASGGPVPVYSDGTTWRRVTDGTVIT